MWEPSLVSARRPGPCPIRGASGCPRCRPEASAASRRTPCRRRPCRKRPAPRPPPCPSAPGCAAARRAPGRCSARSTCARCPARLIRRPAATRRRQARTAPSMWTNSRRPSKAGCRPARRALRLQPPPTCRLFRGPPAAQQSSFPPPAAASQHAHMLQAAHLFRAFDADASGHLTIDEFVAAVDAILHGDRRQRLAVVFKIFDRDGTGHIDADELSSARFSAGSGGRCHIRRLLMRHCRTRCAVLCCAVKAASL